MGLDVSLSAKRDVEVYTSNITHNLNSMAQAAEVYQALWRPEELGVSKAADLIPFLEKGLENLINKESEMKKHEPKNGWGTYNSLVNFVENYLDACIENQDAEIRVSR